MANHRLRDRDAIISQEGLVFRVFGYNHPETAFICDAEYASADIFTSSDPRAPRTGGKRLFYKFYNDEGLNLVFSKYPQYTLLHEMLNQKVVGINDSDITETRKPDERLEVLTNSDPMDELQDAMLRVLRTVMQGSSLSLRAFGVFGSMLHGFHHPKFSDIDLIVYGKKANVKVRQTLKALYSNKYSGFKNEFEKEEVMNGKRWRFKNYSVKEFVKHQERKQIYGYFDDRNSGRIIKAEFEPVKAWNEILSEYDPKTRIVQKGWVKLEARVTDASDGPFIPSAYAVEPTKVLEGSRDGLEVVRVFSYMEEFRLQAENDERIVVEGNLEEVHSPKGNFHQVTLTYCPRYYEQVLKVCELSS